MTNKEKQELKELAKRGLSFEQIRARVSCSDSTIWKYIKYFRNPSQQQREATHARAD